ncbi:MAG: hypothetical protein P4L53_05310 [Candidatus Obscuribacterales bacterium]|nr:hypothetical protein [Candidatus Obscuribacterales bacterium]
MTFFACGALFLLASLCFVGTYQYLVPKFSGGAVSFSTGDLWQKMLLGFVLTVTTVILGWYVAPYLLVPFLVIATSSGAFGGFGILGAAMVLFVVNSLIYGFQTWIFGLARPKVLRCASIGGALRAGIAPALVSTILSMLVFGVFISTLHID